VDGSELRDWIMDHHSLLAEDISTSSWLPWRTWTGWNESSEKQLSTETTLFLSRFGTFSQIRNEILKMTKKAVSHFSEQVANDYVQFYTVSSVE